MKTIQATDVTNRFDEIMDTALIEPIVIEKSGSKSVVLISSTEYERLTALDNAYWAGRANVAEESGFVSADELNRLIERS